jgi:hypothetical protein
VRPGTVVRLALAGTRTDTLRVALTATSAALATGVLLAAATVSAITGSDLENGESEIAAQYANTFLREGNMRFGTVNALLLFAVPILALTAQCIRIGSPGRDRRLAAVRLAGATPRQAVLIAVAETTVSALLGALLAFCALLAARSTLDRPMADGRISWPSDVLPAPGMLIVVIAGVPLIAGLFGALLLRRVIVTPLGVVRRTRTRPPRLWPGLLIIAGVVALAVVQPVTRLLIREGGEMHLVPAEVLVIAVVALAVVGIVAGTGWISYTSGRVLHRFGRGPAALIAARRLIADPWHGSRSSAALLAGIVVGAGVLAFRAVEVTTFALAGEMNRRAGLTDGSGVGFGEDPAYYLHVYDTVNLAVAAAVVIAVAGVLIALTESVVARGRTDAAMVAAGVPRRTLAAAIAWQALAPLVPAVLLAMTVGVCLVRAVWPEAALEGTAGGSCDGTESQCADPNSPYWHWTTVPAASWPVPVPLQDLAILGAGTFALMLAVVVAGAFLLRTTTHLEELRVG